MKIGFLGAGHMGRSIIQGLLNSKQYRKEDFKIVVATQDSLEEYSKQGFQNDTDWNYLADCEVVVLAVRPDVVRQEESKLASIFSKQIIISVAAGLSLAYLKSIFANSLVTRVMPNTSSQFNQSMSMIVAEGDQLANDRAEAIFNLLGSSILLAEDKIHVFIAICGSAVAYIYHFLEPLMQLSLSNQISLDDSKLILANLLTGVASNILHSNENLQELENQVAVPNGTTVQAISIFKQHQIQAIINEAIIAVAKKSQELES